MSRAEGQLQRCGWCLGSSVYERYHDREWGVPLRDERAQFEFLCLEGAQAGLSWLTILNKRDNYRRAFDGFDAEKIACYDERKVERLLQDSGIVRNRLKINAFIHNAQCYLALRDEGLTLNDLMWEVVGGQPLQNRRKSLSEIPATTPRSDRLSKILKQRGFKFVGSTICYAHMQAAGLVNDHLLCCHRYNELAA